MTVKELICLLDCIPGDREVFVKTSCNNTEIIDTFVLCIRTDNLIIETVKEES